jgi:hypothetical protein
VYVEAVDFLPGLAGESRVFDANGPYIRILGNGGTFTYSLQPGLFGQSLTKIVGVQPGLPPGGRRPPLQPNVPCETQPAIKSVDTPVTAPPKQVASDLSAPGAKLRWLSAAQATINLVKDEVKLNHLGMRVVPPKSMSTNNSPPSNQSATASSKPAVNPTSRKG